MLKSMHAILAPSIDIGMPWADLPAWRAYPLMRTESLDDLPWVFRMCTALTGYLASPYEFIVFTACIAVTTMLAKNSLSAPSSLELMLVFAALRRASLPSSSTFTVRLVDKNLTHSLRANLYPLIIDVGWILFFTNSFALLSSSAATITTDVVPSPTSRSWSCDNSTKTFAAGC